jgi:hypothetical protein
MLRGGHDIIILNYTGDDLCATLAHELGHYINRRLGGISALEMYPEIWPVPETMRKRSGFEDAFFKNRDEFFAESMCNYLCGYLKPRANLRYAERVLRRVRFKNPEAARLIKRHRVDSLRILP